MIVRKFILLFFIASALLFKNSRQSQDYIPVWSAPLASRNKTNHFDLEFVKNRQHFQGELIFLSILLNFISIFSKDKKLFAQMFVSFDVLLSVFSNI